MGLVQELIKLSHTQNISSVLQNISPQHDELILSHSPLIGQTKITLWTLIGQYYVTGGGCQGDRLQGEVDCGARVLQGVGGEDDHPGECWLLIGQ